jgi:hypothetical protein
MGKYKCRFCNREMIATALSYQSNQYCNHCFNERADSTQKQNLNTFEFMGEKIELENPTPKEKAIELIDKYKPLCGGYWGGKINKEFAKQCALILVNERLEELKFTHIGYGKGIIEGYQKTKVKYWQDVKKEIENYAEQS